MSKKKWGLQDEDLSSELSSLDEEEFDRQISRQISLDKKAAATQDYEPGQAPGGASGAVGDVEMSEEDEIEQLSQRFQDFSIADDFLIAEDTSMGQAGKPMIDYVVICHGSITNEEDVRYKMKSKLSSVSFYTPHKTQLFFLYKDLLNLENLRKMLKRRYEIIPRDRESFLTLPPAYFSGEVKGDLTFMQTMGIYRYEEIQEKEIIEPVKFRDIPCNNAYLVNGGIKTYSRFELVIEDDMRRRGLNFDDYIVNLRLACCRWYSDETSPFYYAEFNKPGTAKKFGDMTGVKVDFTIADDPMKYIQFPVGIGELLNLSLFKLDMTQSQFDELIEEWESAGGALLNITYQGCGLNVLAFLKYLPRIDLVGRVATLYKCGTSIFNFVDYISLRYQRRFCIVRFSEGVERLNAFIRLMLELKSGDQFVFRNIVIPLKLYRSKEDEERQSLGTGHFLILFINDDGEVIFLDPQNMIKAEFFSSFISHEPRIFSIDLIFMENAAENNTLLSHFISNGYARPILRPKIVQWGGRALRSILMENFFSPTKNKEPIRTAMRTALRAPEMRLLEPEKPKQKQPSRIQSQFQLQPQPQPIKSKTKSKLKSKSKTKLKSKSKTKSKSKSKTKTLLMKPKTQEEMRGQMQEALSKTRSLTPEKNADRVRDLLINNLTIPLYVYDEFMLQLQLPKDEIDKFLPQTRKTKSRSRSRSKSKSRSRSKTRTKTTRRSRTKTRTRTRKSTKSNSGKTRTA